MARTSAPRKDKSDDRFMTIRLSQEAHARLAELAEREHRTLAGEIRLAVDRHLEERQAA